MRPINRVLLGTMTVTALLGGLACNQKTEQASRTTTSAGDSSRAESGKTAASRDRALVRFVNADPVQVAVDLWFGDSKAFSEVPYKTTTAYTEVPAHREPFKLRPPGKVADLATNSEGLSAGEHYTLIAIRKKDGTAALNITNDNLASPSVGKAKVRVINAYPNIGEIAVVPSTEPKKEVFSGVNFNSVTNFKEVEPGAFVVKPEDKKARPLNLPDVIVQPDRFYTIVVTGDRVVEMIRIEDQLGRQTAAIR